MPYPKSGKWYFETTLKSDYARVNYYHVAGFCPVGSGSYADNMVSLFDAGDLYEYGAGSAPDTTLFSAGTVVLEDVVGWAVDIDNWKYSVYINGTISSINNRAIPFTVGVQLTPVVISYNMDYGHFVYNFGQRAFDYATPSGYKCLNTANLPDPTIADGSKYFDTILWTGQGNTNDRTLATTTSADLVWTKSRNNAYHHALFDTVRGFSENALNTDNTNSEGTASGGYLKSTTDTTITLAATSDNSNAWYNGSSHTYVAWAWDAGSSVETLSAGDKNSQFVNQDQIWSTYGTFVNDNSTYNWTAVFSRASHYSTGGSMYNNGPSPATWVLTSGLSCSNTVSFYVFGPNVSMTINYGLSDETTFVSTGDNGNYTFTMPFTGTIQNIRMNTAACYLGRISVDGKMLIDSNVTFNVPSSATSITKNDSAGFSITKFNSGTGPSDPSPYTGGGYDYVYHGLNKSPEFIITKSLDSAQNWAVWHEKLGAAPSNYLKLNLADASAGSNYWSPQIEIYEMGQSQSAVAGDYISYNWTSVEGYSAFGSYTGSSTLPFVFTGFKPKFIIVKRTTATNWWMFDSERGTNELLYPNLPNGEGDQGVPVFDFNSNGFKLRVTDGEVNASGGTYIYAAFASHPFKTSRAH
jgi:hypothetical protein